MSEMFEGPVIDRDVLVGSFNSIPIYYRGKEPQFFVMRTPTLTDEGGVWRFEWDDFRKGWLLARYDRPALLTPHHQRLTSI